MSEHNKTTIVYIKIIDNSVHFIMTIITEKFVFQARSSYCIYTVSLKQILTIIIVNLLDMKYVFK